MVGHHPVLAGKCPMTNHYFEHWVIDTYTASVQFVWRRFTLGYVQLVISPAVLTQQLYDALIDSQFIVINAYHSYQILLSQVVDCKISFVISSVG